MSNFDEKTVVVTGGTRGIGLAIVQALSQLGYRVAFCARKSSELEETQKELAQKNSGNVFCQVCDVRDYAQVKSFLDQVFEHFGKIDIFIHNAGIGRFDKIDQLAIEDWQEVIDIDLNGSFYFFHEIIPKMKANSSNPKGYIITIGSLSHRQYVAGTAAYASAKGAQKILADYLFEETREDDILATYLAIGSVNTTFSSRNPDFADRKIQPDEIAEVVQKLVADYEKNPKYCISYCEIRVRRPKKITANKD